MESASRGAKTQFSGTCVGTGGAFLSDFPLAFQASELVISTKQTPRFYHPGSCLFEFTFQIDILVGLARFFLAATMTFNEASSRTLKEEAFPAPSVNLKKHAPGPEKMNSKCGNSKINKEIKRSRAVQVATPQRAKRDCFQPSVLLGGGWFSQK